MTALSVIMLAITTTVTILMVLRIYGDWLRFKEYLQEGEQEKLVALQNAENGWVQRHFICAMAAIIMVAVLEKCTTIGRYEHLDEVTAAYAMISLLLVVVESLFAQRLGAVLANEPGKSRQTDAP